MSDFLTAVKSVQHQKHEPAEPFLTEVKTAKPSRSKRDPPSSISNLHEKTNPNRTIAAHDAGSRKSAETTVATPRTPEEALRLLRSEPSAPALSALLQQLSSKDPFEQTGAGGRFSLHFPGPIQAKIINVLLTTIIPTFWPTLGTTGKALLIACLANVAGASAITARLRYLSLQAKSTNAKGRAISLALEQALDVADQLFRGDEHVSKILIGLETAGLDKVKRELAWKEYVNLMASGKVISAVAEAEDLLKSTSVRDVSAGDTSRTSKPRAGRIWLSDGACFASWLGRNVASSVFTNSAFTVPVGQVLTKALNLGYTRDLLRGLYTELLRTALHVHSRRNDFLKGLVEAMPGYARVQLLEHTLRWLSTLVASEEHLEAPSSAGLQGVEMSPPSVDHEVSAMAALLDALLRDNVTLQTALANILSDPVQSASISYPVRRASVAVLASRVPERLQTLLERTMLTFGDKLFINHAPVLQQESLAQTILLAAGYLHRQNLMAVRTAVRSSGHMQGVSNRLDAANQRARWLGMVVGTALSGLVEKEGAKMSFGTEDMRTRETEWYSDLTGVFDTISSLNEFEALLHRHAQSVTKPSGRVGIHKMKLEAMPKLNGKPLFGPVPPLTLAQTEVEGEKVSEILDEESDEDGEEMVRYAKPDTDPEDSDEDATLVNRHKPRPPVYIRDLMAMLRDSEKADRFQLGVRSAAPLIRRKMGFGREVADHKEELAAILCGLQDPFDTDGFEERRLQALIAVLLSDVKAMAPWFSRQAFTGEYSLAQRCVILTSLGLGGREIAGIENEDELNPQLSNTAFPSKRLPPRLHAIYSPADSATKRLESASKDVEHALIKPLALSAADNSSAHLNAVKIRTFSSRMQLERTNARKLPTNDLAKVFGQAFFFPLVNRYQQNIAAYGNGSTYSSAPSFPLVTFLKTLALLLHASGPATLGLEQVTTEFWELLLSLRVRAVSDISVLEAVLFALLTLLEVNSHSKRRLAEEHAYSLMETKEWVELVFERTGEGGLVDDGGGDNQEAKVRALAAGVLVRTTEVMDAYQQEHMGYTMR